MFSVVIVEDEIFLRRELEETIPWSRHGFFIAGTAGSFAEAEKLFDNLVPDLIITDIRLPGGDGLDLIGRFSPRAAIVITGHDQFEYAHKALRLGAADFLLKPIDDDELEQALRKVQLSLAGTRLRSAAPGAGPSPATSSPGAGIPDTRERHAAAAEDFIRRRYRDDISLAETAEELGLSESYLSRIIRELRNRTFVEMLTSYRLEIAAELLRDQRLRIGEIARLCGFRDQGYFARTFKKSFDSSPTLYRSCLAENQALVKGAAELTEAGK